MSFLFAEGHPDARHYPLRMLWDEERIASARVDAFLASQALLTQLAAGSIFSKDAAQKFGETIKRMHGGHDS